MKCDFDLLKNFFYTNVTCTSDLLYLESGKLPIEHIIAKRRFMYLFHILTRSTNELIFKTYLAQSLKPSRNDWFLTIQDEKKKYDISLSDFEISQLSKSQFRKIVCDKIHKYAFSSLIEIGKTHSKSKEIVESLKCKLFVTQPYLLTSQLTTSQRQLLFSTRCKTYDVKSNYKHKYSHDMSCRFCKKSNNYEDMKHLLSCETLMIDSNNSISYDDIYGNLEVF